MEPELALFTTLTSRDQQYCADNCVDIKLNCIVTKEIVTHPELVNTKKPIENVLTAAPNTDPFHSEA